MCSDNTEKAFRVEDVYCLWCGCMSLAPKDNCECTCHKKKRDKNET
jgi:hypothetical protein